jgi:hypothetical protein
MKSVLVYDYSGQGEGQTIKIVFTNSPSITDEQALADMKEDMDGYFHVGIKLIDLECIAFDSKWMRLIEAHVPVLFKYITGNDKDYLLSIDYDYHVNYS